MNTAELKEYLGIVVDMEKNIYLQAKTAGEIIKKISLLGHRNSFVKPVEPPIPMRPSTQNIFTAFVIPYVVSFFIFYLMIMINTGGDTGPGTAPFIAVNTIFWGTIISVPICIGRTRFNTTARKYYDNAINEYNSNLAQYQEALRKYQDNLTEEKKRLDSENIQKTTLQNSLEKLQGQNETSREILQKIYSKNIRYPK